MKTVFLAGCGKMGSAMLAGWLTKLSEDLRFIVFDPMIADDHFAHSHDNVVVLNNLPDTLPELDVIVLAMKPQMLPDALPDLLGFSSSTTVWLSIAAGITTSSMRTLLGSDALVIRAMPNTPAAIGRGITAMLIDDDIPDVMSGMAQKMMKVVGEVVLVDEEIDMDRVTALSGSGPAYVFLMREVMENAGISAGLSQDLAAKLAAATLSGAVALMDESSETPEQLRINVTSPNGTTQAALDVLMSDNAFSRLMEKAVLAAKDRSIELGK